MNRPAPRWPIWRALLLAGFITLVRASPYPAPQDYGPTNTYGAGVQRSLRLMASSSPEQKKTVRVLFYGQSITEQYWSVMVGDQLRAWFPNANLIITNLAISYTSDLLWKTAETDIYPFYPDLMIFHDFGSIGRYEDIIARTRLRTTADLVLQTDLPVVPGDLVEPTDPHDPAGLTGAAWHNYYALPDVALRYGAELCDLRTYWKQYLARYGYAPLDLLRDHVHPNKHGDYVMAQLTQSCLRVDESFPDAEWRGAVADFVVGRDVHWTNGALSLPFVGNRVEAVLAGEAGAPVQVRIDGQPPSAIPELAAFARTDFYPGTRWLGITRITSRRPVIAEDWTLTVRDSITNDWPPRLSFSLEGSKTGPDGEGWSTNLFVSNSGRVVIDPDGWLMLFWAFLRPLPKLPEGHQIRWRSFIQGIDEFTPEIENPGLEPVVTLAHGLANGSHVLTLQAADESARNAIRAIRVFNPLARLQPPPPSPPVLSSPALRDGLLNFGVVGYGRSRYVVETASEAGGPWSAFTAAMSEPKVSLPASAERRFIRVRKID